MLKIYLSTIYTPLLAVVATEMTNFNGFGVQLKDSGAYAFPLEAGLWILDRLNRTDEKNPQQPLS